MDPERYRKAGDLYHAALELTPEDRSAFLERACGGDVDLRREVESLLAAHQQAGHFIEEPHQEASSLLRSMLESAGSGSPRMVSSGNESAEDRDEASLTPGQRLGRYEVLDLIGTGGMGRVYRALDSSLGREVAIKTLAGTFRGDASSLKRFEREARVLATLSHPSIATIYGFEQLDGAPYLVLERVDGHTLADRLQRGAISIKEAIGIAMRGTQRE